ncbi:EamA family transporter RarD [Streptomyces caatingaensis]|uniref:Protein rarD n=1 Tax=Streptomyces caatingaensis TaxID=1678637 RepID=A0A0K9X9D9_9ACTN|nr:EamA family transporter RarD [Streptomyces caatingaensis]KNB50055.1 protein rarD [Streptomyces caatingaensis]
MKPDPQEKNEARTGFLCGVAAYAIWGLFPLYWPLLEPSGATEILAHRMVWSLVTVVAVLAVTRRWAWIPPLLRQPKRLGMIALGAATISVNWGIYIWAVNSGHVVETSLGYFINPLVVIALGVVVLRERLRRAQWAAVGIGAVAVVVLAVGYGKLPWIALGISASFGTYSLIKKQVGLGGLESMAAETAVQFLPALGFLLFLGGGGGGGSTFVSAGAGHMALLIASGAITALPLVSFGAAAVRLPLSVLGMLQYLAPVFQFALGLAVFHESMPPERWAGFALVWLALAVLTWDAMRTARAGRAELAAARDAALDAAPDQAAPTGRPISGNRSAVSETRP